MRKVLVSLILVMTMITVACSPLEQQARDTAAALQGALVTAQTQYTTTCQANSRQTPCTIINQAIEGQNALVTAVEAYCGWSQSAPPVIPTATCVPVKSAQAGLQTAINNAQLFITELKGIVKP